MSNIKTFVFFDSETTGLPSQENNQTRITELCLIAVKSCHLLNDVPVRIQNKLNLCVNPDKIISPIASDLTGLTNDLLELQPKFDSTTYKIVCDFLSLHEQPVCLVAHNGDGFDYPILRAEIHKADGKLSDKILCVDSLSAFRELSKEGGKKNHLQAEKVGTSSRKRFTHDRNPPFESKRIRLQQNKSFKLGDVYTKLTGKKPVNAHEAEADVSMLIESANVLGSDFIEWSNLHAKPFNDIPMMEPGRRF